MSYKSIFLLFICVGVHIFPADKNDSADRLILSFDDGQLSVDPSRLNTFGFFKNMAASEDIVPIPGSVSIMESILSRSFKGKTVHELVKMVDLIERLDAPLDDVDKHDLIKELQNRFFKGENQKESYVDDVFDSEGPWSMSLKRTYASFLIHQKPFGLDLLRKQACFTLPPGYKIKGVSCNGTYALVSRFENCRQTHYGIIDLNSQNYNPHVIAEEQKSYMSFSDFHDSLLLRNGDSQIKILDCLKKSWEEIPIGKYIWSSTLDPKGETIAIGSDESIMLIDRQKKKITGSRQLDNKKIIFIKFSPDGESLITVEEGLKKGSLTVICLRNAADLDLKRASYVTNFKRLTISPDGLKAVEVRTPQGNDSSRLIDLTYGKLKPVDKTYYDKFHKVENIFFFNGQPMMFMRNYIDKNYAIAGKKKYEMRHLGALRFFPLELQETSMFSSGKRLIHQQKKVNNGQRQTTVNEVAVYETELDVTDETIQQIPLSLFYILFNQFASWKCVPSHIERLELIKNRITGSGDKKIIESLLEILSKKHYI